MLNVPENELFSAYLDGELTAEEQAEMERVLNTSPAARQLLDELRALSATLQSLPVVELKEDLSGRVLRAAERQMLSEPPGSERTRGASGRETAPLPRLLRRVLRGRALWWSGAAVAVALLLFLGDLNDRAERPGGSEGGVAVNTGISADPRDKVPEVWAAEDSHGSTVAAADSPRKESAVESPGVEKSPPHEQANERQTMIAGSDNPAENPVASDRPTPDSVTPADDSPEAAKPRDRVLIVKCEVSEKAADGQVLNEILAKRKIARLNNGTDAETGTMFVEVDLTPTQIRALVADLESRHEHFAAVSVPSIPGAAAPRIPSAAGPSHKATVTVRVGPATAGGVGAAGNGKSLTGSAPATCDNNQRNPVKIDARTNVSKSGQETDKPVPKPGVLDRSSREEAKFRVRFELKVVAPAAGEPVSGESSAPSQEADAAPKSEK